jgi:hypothetical protein
MNMGCPAWIDIGDGSGLHDCTLVDISDHGARLVIEEAVTVPDNLSLLLYRDGEAFPCEIIWRCNCAIGIQFATPRPIQEYALAPNQAAKNSNPQYADDAPVK